MVDSGIKATKEFIEAYYDLQKNKKYKFLVGKFNDKFTNVVISDTGEKDATFDDLKKVIPKDHVRYIYYDCEYYTKGGQKRNKVISVSWSSDDDAPLKEKMLVAGTSKELQRVCKDFAKHASINSWDELTEDIFIDKVSDNREK